MRTGILIAMAMVATHTLAAELNYDEMIPLDAEALAETGVKAAIPAGGEQALVRSVSLSKLGRQWTLSYC